jgi:hypothetical protein
MERAWLQRSLEHNRENQNELWQRSLDLGARAAAWVLAANAGALVLCFNALISGHLCDWSAVRFFGSVFFLGTMCAYLSVLCEQRSFGAFSLPLANFVAKGTAALGLLDQLKSIEQLKDSELTEEVMQFYRETKAKFDKAKVEIDSMDLAPGAAANWMHGANWALAVSCACLGVGTLGAIWFLPTNAVCAAP